MIPTELTVAKLRSELQGRGLSTDGLKAVLVERLTEALAGDSGAGGASDDEGATPVGTVQGGAGADAVVDVAAGKKKRRPKKKHWAVSAATVVDAKAGVDGRSSPADSGVEIEYVAEPLVDVTVDPAFADFVGVFARYEAATAAPLPATPAAELVVSEGDAAKQAGIFNPFAAGKDDGLDSDGEKDGEGEEPKLSRAKQRKLSRMSVAQLKQVAKRPDLVEAHDVTSSDPRFLLHLKAYRNTVAVPIHWCQKRKYLQGKRGIEKPPFDLPDYIRRTGITEMREALTEKEDRQGLKGKMREKARPKMGKIDIDYQKLHDAFFRFQTKPRMLSHGDIYHEGKEFETKMREKKPGDLSDELKTALGMPVGAAAVATPVPPPWLLHMQRYGPPPSYPSLKIPGLNAPIPPNAVFGFHPGGWGKPPVDEFGRPLYGDVFGAPVTQAAAVDLNIDRRLWGAMESDASDDSSEDESEAEGEAEAAGGQDDDTASGIMTPSGIATSTPSGITSLGIETPDAIELRKRKTIEESMDQTTDQPLYRVLQMKETKAGSGALMGSTHQYDVRKGDVNFAVENPEELEGLDADALQERYAQLHKAAAPDREDVSDLMADHARAQAAKKRKSAPSAGGKDDKAAKKFKF